MVRTRHFFALLTAASSLLSFVASSTSARNQPPVSGTVVREAQKATASAPAVTYATHNLGKIALTVTNNGTFGKGFISVTGDTPSCEYPVHSNLEYLFGAAFWIGAIVGRDTLVSLGTDGWSNPSIKELWPADSVSQLENGERLKIRSISDPTNPEFALAKSERDVTSVYYDTLTSSPVIPDGFDARPHRPLNIKVRETSYSWSYKYAEDFVLFDYQITNIGIRALEKVYMGIYVDGDAGFNDEVTAASDDICGFRRAVEGLDLTASGCQFSDTINIAWIADNNGIDDPTDATVPGIFGRQDPIAVAGTRVVRTPNKDSLDISFNWWVSNTNPSLDFGPRLRGTDTDPFRDFGGFLGTPEGDKNKYYMMRHKEFDYDQLFSASDSAGGRWLPPSSQSSDIANGFDTRYLLSFGPFTIFPGETLPLTFAHVCGDNFHRSPPRKMTDIFDPSNPQQYYDRYLDFTDLGTNAQWASWIYDNPGVDTDGDGHKGKYRICYGAIADLTVDTFFSPDDPLHIDSIVIDTTYRDSSLVYYQGDGIPDFRGATPPPAPTLRVLPEPGKLVVRWSGLRSETTPDDFSSALDFEGYRVYIGLSNLASDLMLQSSYDRENYRKYFFNPALGANGEFSLDPSPPKSKALIQALYANGNPNYDPASNTLDNPLRFGDSLFYFTAQDFNRDNLRDTTGIHKIYLNAPYPHTLLIDSAFAYGVDTFWVDTLSGDTTYYPNGELTPDGRYFQHFEYEYKCVNLQASQLHYVTVTAFDFGAPASGLESLESNPLLNAVADYPLNRSDVIAAGGLRVGVFPNPYRIDGAYRDNGFEGRENTDLPDDGVRAIHFYNRPPSCTIRIFTLDGDLVREIEHNTLPNAPESMHDVWNLITRNRQQAVSGLYYWVVESAGQEAQVGKLVLIM